MTTKTIDRGLMATTWMLAGWLLGIFCYTLSWCYGFQDTLEPGPWALGVLVLGAGRSYFLRRHRQNYEAQRWEM